MHKNWRFEAALWVPVALTCFVNLAQTNLGVMPALLLALCFAVLGFHVVWLHRRIAALEAAAAPANEQAAPITGESRA